MKYEFLVLLTFLCVTATSDAREIAWFGALDMTSKSDIVVVGTVEVMTPYWDDDVHGGTILTDVVVRADQILKGEPTLGKNHVKFAIEGGTAYVAKHEMVLSRGVSPQPKFEIGEQALLFLRVGKADGYYKHFPHGRLHVLMWEVGKKDIDESGVMFGYEYESKVKRTYIPLELTKVLIQAYLKDKNGAKAIENEIKELVSRSNRTERSVVLPTASAAKMKKKADNILKKEKK